MQKQTCSCVSHTTAPETSLSTAGGSSQNVPQLLRGGVWVGCLEVDTEPAVFESLQSRTLNPLKLGGLNKVL
eukprot:5418558-Amphidinium_carterae.1